MGLDFDSQKAKGVSGSAGKVLAVWSLDDQQSLQVSAQAQGSFILLHTNSLIGRNNI